MNDLWGWTADDGTQIAVVGASDRTVFLDVTHNFHIQHLGFMVQTGKEIRMHKDVKIWDSYAFVSSEAPGFGIQIIDLKSLVGHEASIWHPDVIVNYPSYTCHNLVINDDIPVLYTVSSSTCKTLARFEIINLNSTTQETTLSPGLAEADCLYHPNITEAHDAQCVIYDGPDTRYTGEEICFISTGMNKAVAVYSWTTKTLLSRATYNHSIFSHQSWLSEDKAFLFHNDELDFGNHRTQIFDVRNLTNIIELPVHETDDIFISHNMYTVNKLLFQANYAGGLRVLTWDQAGALTEVGYFDVSAGPEEGWYGSWSVYPYFREGSFPAGKKVVLSSSDGVHVLTLNENLHQYLHQNLSAINGEEYCEAPDMLRNEGACKSSTCCGWNTWEAGEASNYGAGRCFSDIGRAICNDMANTSRPRVDDESSALRLSMLFLLVVGAFVM